MRNQSARCDAAKYGWLGEIWGDDSRDDWRDIQACDDGGYSGKWSRLPIPNCDRRKLDSCRGRRGHSAVLGATRSFRKHDYGLQIDKRIHLDYRRVDNYFDDGERANRVGCHESPRRDAQHVDVQQRHCHALKEMSVRQVILIVGATALIIIGVVSRRQSAPLPESGGDAEPDVGKARQSALQRSLVRPPNHASLPAPSEEELERVRQLAESDPRAAAFSATSLLANPARVEAIRAAAIAWANQDLAGAIEWGHRLSDENERQKALVSIGYEAVRSEPLRALALAMELKAEPDRDELIRHAAGEWALTTPRAAAEWARQIDEPSLRTRALANVATAWAEMDPRAAAALAIEELEPGRLQEDTLVSIVQRWAQGDPADAAAWISTFEEGELRAAAIHNVVKLWSDQNRAEAGEWLNALPPGPMRTLAMAAYVEQIAPAFPAQASQWAN